MGFAELGRTCPPWEGLTAEAAGFLELAVHWMAVCRRVGFGDLGPYFLLSV